MIARRSFEEIRLPFCPSSLLAGGTSAAGLRASFMDDLATRLRAFSFDTTRLAGRFAFRFVGIRRAIEMPNIKNPRVIIDHDDGTCEMVLNRAVSTFFDATDRHLIASNRWYAVRGAGAAG